MLCRIAWCAIRNAYCCQDRRNREGGGAIAPPYFGMFVINPISINDGGRLSFPHYYSCPTGFSDLPTALNLCSLLFVEECRIAVMNKEKMSTGLPRRHLNWTLKKNEWHETYSFSTYSVIWIYFLCSTNSYSYILSYFIIKNYRELVSHKNVGAYTRSQCL